MYSMALRAMLSAVQLLPIWHHNASGHEKPRLKRGLGQATESKPRLKRGLGQATACSKINYSRLLVSRTEGEMVAIRASVRDEQPRRSVKLCLDKQLCIST